MKILYQGTYYVNPIQANRFAIKQSSNIQVLPTIDFTGVLRPSNIKQGSGIVLTTANSDVTIAANETITGATNLGGLGLYVSTTNKHLNLKGLNAGSNIVLTPTSTGITISSTASGGGGSGTITGATNGLSLSSTLIKLGGVLNQNTIISGTSKTFQLYVSGVTFGQRLANKLIGTNSFAQGINTTASGNTSSAFGSGTVAGGINSFASGLNSKAIGDYSSVFGFSNTSSGFASHAEGGATIASSQYAHSEGNGTTASGNYAHAEGVSTTASGNGSHAEGEQTTALGTDSHAEGFYTKAGGQASHSGGQGFTSKLILANGIGSFNHSTQTSSGGTNNFGALSDGSAILGGFDHNIAIQNLRAVVLGGRKINLTGSTYTDFVAVPNLAIFTTPAAGGTSDVLTWNSSTKKIGKVTQASLASGSGNGFSGATNGLTLTAGKKVKLGGALTGATTIDFSDQSLLFNSTDASTNSLFDVELNNTIFSNKHSFSVGYAGTNIQTSGTTVARMNVSPDVVTMSVTPKNGPLSGTSFLVNNGQLNFKIKNQFENTTLDIAQGLDYNLRTGSTSLSRWQITATSGAITAGNNSLVVNNNNTGTVNNGRLFITAPTTGHSQLAFASNGIAEPSSPGTGEFWFYKNQLKARLTGGTDSVVFLKQLSGLTASALVGIKTITGVSYNLASGDIGKLLICTNVLGTSIILNTGLTAGFNTTIVKFNSATGGTIVLNTGSGAVLNSENNTIYITNTCADVIKTSSTNWFAFGSLGTAFTGSTGGGTITGATNLSGGLGIYTTTASKNLQLKSFKSGLNLAIVSSANTLNFSVTGLSSTYLKQTAFNIYSGTTQTSINSKLSTASFNFYTGTTEPNLYAKKGASNLFYYQNFI